MALGAVLAAGSVLQGDENPKSAPFSKAYGTDHATLPLPFDPKSLKGISENVIVSHHDNNYAGAVKKLNLIQKRLGTMPDSAHPVEYGALKKEELIALNSKLLHELYFNNLGGSGAITPQMRTWLSQGFGSPEAWEKDFVKTAKSLGGGSGWVILSYLRDQNLLINQIASDHSDSTATGTPLLVLDMYEHAYHMDYGASAGAYISAFMQNINWIVVSGRLASA